MKYIYAIFSLAFLHACANEPAMNEAQHRISDERLVRPDSMESDNTAVADSSSESVNPNVGLGGK